MGAGRTWPAEWRTLHDPVSGVEIRQLTDYLGHSHHVYFTNPGWFAGGKRMLFSSDRENRTNLFAIDLTSGEIVQLTDLEPLPPPHEVGFLKTAVNPTREEAYFWHGRQVHVHPRFSPDGRHVVYTSDRSGYGNVYWVRVPEFDALSRIEDVEG